MIAAVADDLAIGRDNALLWHISADMKYFRRTTMGCPVIMGFRTWESIGRPLPGRLNIVITRHHLDAPDTVLTWLRLSLRRRSISLPPAQFPKNVSYWAEPRPTKGQCNTLTLFILPTYIPPCRTPMRSSRPSTRPSGRRPPTPTLKQTRKTDYYTPSLFTGAADIPEPPSSRHCEIIAGRNIYSQKIFSFPHCLLNLQSPKGLVAMQLTNFFNEIGDI